MKKLYSSPLFRFYTFLPVKWRILYVIGLVGSSFQTFLVNFVTAMGIRMMTDGIQAGSFPDLARGALFLLLGLVSVMIIIPLIWVLFYRAVLEIKRHILYALYDSVYDLPLSYIEKNHSGDLISRLTNDVETSEKAYGWQVKMLFQSMFAGIGGIATIFVLDWRLGIGTLIIGAMVILLNVGFVRPMRKMSVKVQESLSGTTQRLSDIIAGREIIKMFSLRRPLLELFERENAEARRWGMKHALLAMFASSGGNLIYLSSYIGFFIIGSIFILQNSLTIGTLIAVTELAGGALWMFWGFGNFISQIQESLAGADRTFEIIDTPKEALVTGTSKPKHSDALDAASASTSTSASTSATGNAIELESVCHSYGESSPTVLDGLSIDVKTGEMVALVGTSGGGKSTLFKLLMGLYLPTSGTIRVFGRDILDFAANELRSLIAFVPQNTYLFDGTVRENIAHGRQDATDERITECAKAAHAHEFICGLKDGYDTQVGERGVHLSGGQKQRIAIARALLKDAPILLLDEATASLDSESEQLVQAAIEVLIQGRTVLAAAHRLPTIRNADRIIVLESGGIVEQGSHDELVEAKGRYYELHELQYT